MSIGPKNGPDFVDGESYSSCDGGESWFAVGRGARYAGPEGSGIQMVVSHVDTERNIVYYEPAKDDN